MARHVRITEDKKRPYILYAHDPVSGQRWVGLKVTCIGPPSIGIYNPEAGLTEDILWIATNHRSRIRRIVRLLCTLVDIITR